MIRALAVAAYLLASAALAVVVTTWIALLVTGCWAVGLAAAFHQGDAP